ncbi:MAG TPA: ribonuclease HI family protein [Clostridia bacterium]|nr:ribonuclease HI family protein [Clostridia bacterium]
MSQLKQSLYINTDGGARGNPGPAAIGVYIRDYQGREIAKFGKRIGKTTNNVAEYQAVIEALKWLEENKERFNAVLKINFFIDSNLVVNQLRGLFKVKEPHLKKLFLKIKFLERKIDSAIYYQYVPRQKNRIADALVNRTLSTSI